MTSATHISDKPSFLSRFFKWHYLFLFVIIVLLLIRLKLVFSYNTDLDGTEFGFLHNAQLLYKGIPLYRNPDAFPFYAVIYNPLYYYLMYWCACIFHINPLFQVHELLIIARSINLGLMIVSLYLLYKLLSRFSLSINHVYLLLLCFMLLITGHFYVARPDGFKITFFIAQLYAVLQYFYFDKREKRYLVAVLVCNTLSFLLKQDSIVYANLCLFVLIVCKRNKESVFLFIACLVSVIASYGICILLFSKNLFVSTFIYNFQVITDFKHSYNIIVIFLSIVRLSPLLLVCSYTIYSIRKKMVWNSVELFLTICLIILFFTAHIFMLKSGAYINYSFEAIVILIILCGKLIHDAVYSSLLKKYVSPVLVLYAVFISLTNGSLTNYTLRKERLHPYQTYYNEHFSTSNEIKKIIKDDVFFLPNCSNLIYYADYKNIFYGHDAHIDRFINLYLHIPVKSKLLFASSEKMDKCFSDGTVKYIVIENDSISQAHVKLYYPNYKPVKSVQKFLIYQFNKNSNQ